MATLIDCPAPAGTSTREGIIPVDERRRLTKGNDMNIGMNQEVLSKFGGSIEELSAEHFSIVAPDGSKIGPFNHPPDWRQLLETVQETDQALAITPAQCLNNSAQACLEFVGRQRSITADRRLSAEGRSEQLVPVIEKAFLTIGPSVAAMAKHQALIADRAAQRYTVPALASADIVAALQDAEILSYVRTLSRAGKSELEREFLAGKHSRIAEAVLRSPVAFSFGDVAQIADQSWRASIDAKDPKGLQVLRAATEYSDWAARAVGAFQSRLVNATGVDRAQQYSLIKSHGPEHWGFSAEEALAFDNRERWSKRH